VYGGPKPHQITNLTVGQSQLPVGYDSNGNLYSKPTPSGTVINTYNALDRLVSSVNQGSGQSQTQQYDYSGRRVLRQENGGPPKRFFSKLVEFDGTTVNKYYYAGDRLIAVRWVSDSTFGTKAPPAVPLRIPPELPVAVGLAAALLLIGFGRRERRIGVVISPSRALGAALLIITAAPPVTLVMASAARADCDPDFNLLHYHLDHLGSTQVITNDVGAIYLQVRYTAYGQIRGRWDGNGAPVTSNSAGLTREFTGYESDGVTGFEYAGARFYDSALGQFLSHDPKGQFASPYAYGPGDPMNTVDSTGTTSTDPGTSSIDPGSDFGYELEFEFGISLGGGNLAGVLATGEFGGGSAGSGFSINSPTIHATIPASDAPKATAVGATRGVDEAQAGYEADPTRMGSNAPASALGLGDPGKISGTPSQDMPSITPGDVETIRQWTQANSEVRDIPNDAKIVIDRTFEGTENADAAGYYDRNSDTIHIAADKLNNMANAANYLVHENEHRARPILSGLAALQDKVQGENPREPNLIHRYFFFDVGNKAQDLYIQDARQGLVPLRFSGQ
jgi:RHS repeat-associated protein